MSDRLVRKVSPTPNAGELPQLFSTYLKVPNIVLLGDPGAGKSHLFRQFSKPAAPVRARDFINIDFSALPQRESLYIDGLDEKRAGRGDQNTIDEIVRKLFLIKPKQVRISCRAADWLGESDLAAFRAYFDQFGGVTVLSLEPLTQTERCNVLASCGVLTPAAFLQEAEQKGLDELLTNPQNLIMLSDVVKKRNWPRSRRELFKHAVDILLSEPNPEHTYQTSGAFSPDELIDPAGAICAARLIADVDGICLANKSAGDAYPSYRTIGLSEPNKVLAALGRRAFATGAVLETVDYAHRTTAEYLAAHWIAEGVRAGLPIGRVRALMGVDGRPASELRGLHAWLAVLLPECASALIDVDPFGVLSYGDAASLSSADRIHLITAISKLSEVDPWFRHEDWSPKSMAALSGVDMTSNFRTILENEQAGFGLRSVVLDALSAGCPIPALNDILVRIFLTFARSYRERNSALDALVNSGSDGATLAARAYSRLTASADDLRLRAASLRHLGGTYLAVTEVARLLSDALRTDDKLIVGAFWGLDVCVPDADIGRVLDETDTPDTRILTRGDRRNAGEVLVVFDQLLIRLLESDSAPSGELFLSWLLLRSKLVDHYHHGHAEELRNALSSNKRVRTSLIGAALRQLIVDEHSWSVLHSLSKLLVGAADDATTLTSLMVMLPDTRADTTRSNIYQTAMACCFRLGEEARPTFEALFSYAEDIANLKAVRTSCCYWEIPDWRIDESNRRDEQDAKRRTQKAKTVEEFEKEKEAIVNGTHIGWLAWIGRVYFSQFSDVDRQGSERERLVTEIGEENADIAIEGLKAFVLRGHITAVDDVIRMHADNKIHWWWYAVIAGLDELMDSGTSIDALPEAYLRSALAIELLHPTHEQVGNVIHEIEHVWKEAILKGNPDWVRDVYIKVARSALLKKAEYIDGLHRLMHLPELSQFAAQIATDLVEEFPLMSNQLLMQLLPTAISDGNTPRIIMVIERALEKCAQDDDGNVYSSWLAAGLLLDLEQFKPLVNALLPDARKRVVWSLRDISSVGIRKSESGNKLSPASLEFFLLLAAPHFTLCEPPSSGWSGDRNEWDATQYMRKMIDLLSADPSDAAAEALARLSKESALATFHDHINHARATQLVRQVDSKFQQPSWSSTISALANRTPANVADLHALVLAHLSDLKPWIAASNTDVYKQFWNEDRYGRPIGPKIEESCRDVLVGLLRGRLGPHNVAVDPEGHMANDKRADIAVSLPGMKVVVELKRDYHQEVWSAISDQLERFYTRDPEAQGFGIYGVFWFGEKRPNKIPKPPARSTRPASATEMQSQLSESVPQDKRYKVVPVVIDVSGHL